LDYPWALIVFRIGIFVAVLGADWKEEFGDGRCKVKLEAKCYEFKKEVKCEGIY